MPSGKLLVLPIVASGGRKRRGDMADIGNPSEQTERNQPFRDQSRALDPFVYDSIGPNLYTMVPSMFAV